MKKITTTLILVFTKLSASTEAPSQALIAPPAPWLTGSLIAPIGEAVPYGHFVIKSYVDFTATSRGSDQHSDWILGKKHIYSISPKFLCYFGLTPWCDMNIAPELRYSFTNVQQSFQLADLKVGLDFQLLASNATPYFPGIKFAVTEIFPTGNFEWLTPRKTRTDVSGYGSFATQFNLIFYKLFSVLNTHWLSTTLSAQYTVHLPTKIHDFNTYGGGFGTRGTVLPGNSFQGILSFEFTFNQNWAFALDNVYNYASADEFLGRPGISLKGAYANVQRPSSENLSLAPAIEYNFSKNFGIIGGCWFSVWGRNSLAFAGGILNFNYSY